MKLDFTETKIKELENEFIQLDTIEARFDFWLEKMKMPYFLWSHFEYDCIKKFIIKANSSEEQEKINNMTLELYVERISPFQNKAKVFNFEIMKDLFLQKYDEIPNKLAFHKKEIDSLVRRVSERDGKIADKFDNTKLFYDKGYNDYYLENKKPDLTRSYEIENLISLMNGYSLAQYHKFLDDFLNKPVLKDKLTHIEQILVLEYFGIINSKKTSTQNAEICAPVIRRDIETTRQILSSIQLSKSEKNLIAVYDYFFKNRFFKEAELVKIDIDKKNRRK